MLCRSPLLSLLLVPALLIAGSSGLSLCTHSTHVHVEAVWDLCCESCEPSDEEGEGPQAEEPDDCADILIAAELAPPPTAVASTACFPMVLIQRTHVVGLLRAEVWSPTHQPRAPPDRLELRSVFLRC